MSISDSWQYLQWEKEMQVRTFEHSSVLLTRIILTIGLAVESCKTQRSNVDDHFREVTKMVTLGSGATREVQDYMLTRFTCYLIAQNGDPRKEQIAFAQSYFAVQSMREYSYFRTV